jgi:hypothetical protein
MQYISGDYSGLKGIGCRPYLFINSHRLRFLNIVGLREGKRRLFIQQCISEVEHRIIADFGNPNGVNKEIDDEPFDPAYVAVWF